MTSPGGPPPGRADVIAILATMGERSPDEVAEEIGSLELAWLVSQVEELSRRAREVAANDMALYDGIAASQRQFEEGRQTAVEWEEVRDLLEAPRMSRQPLGG